MSIVSSAQRHHLVVHDYLEDVLAKLAEAAQHHPRDLALGCEYLLDLLPDRWAAAHPGSIRHERVEEKKVVAETKRLRRAGQRMRLADELDPPPDDPPLPGACVRPPPAHPRSLLRSRNLPAACRLRRNMPLPGAHIGTAMP